MKPVLLLLSFLFLLLLEIARVYFIMPFPGSQYKETIDIAYWLHQHINWLRIAGWILTSILVIAFVRTGKKSARLIVGSAFLVYAIVFYFFNFRMLADKMFLQPRTKELVGIAENKIPEDKLVIALTVKGESRAYPIQVIGYHHQVRDTVGGIPVMVTYCTVCRTGRVFSPIVKGQAADFRLVGMDHFNAMFEDNGTGSWWRQSTGEAIKGPLKGSVLEEIPSQQTSLKAWIQRYPGTKILQYDPSFKEEYEELAEYDKGHIESSLEKRDSASWKFKSWVVGIRTPTAARAYDWNELVKKQFIQDSIPGLPLMLVLENDTSSFHVFNRMLGTHALAFAWNQKTQQLQDLLTGSGWDLNGTCITGPLTGMQLQRIQAYQEFWHSWKSFHPSTTRYPE